MCVDKTRSLKCAALTPFHSSTMLPCILNYDKDSFFASNLAQYSPTVTSKLFQAYCQSKHLLSIIWTLSIWHFQIADVLPLIAVIRISLLVNHGTFWDCTASHGYEIMLFFIMKWEIEVVCTKSWKSTQHLFGLERTGKAMKSCYEEHKPLGWNNKERAAVSNFAPNQQIPGISMVGALFKAFWNMKGSWNTDELNGSVVWCFSLLSDDLVQNNSQYWHQ